MIPILLLLGTAASGILGAASGVSGKGKLDEAGRIAENARKRHQAKVKQLQESVETTQQFLSDLGQQKLLIQAHTLKRFVELIRRFKPNTTQRIKTLQEELLSNQMPVFDLGKAEALSFTASEILATGAKGISTGALAAIGAGGLASTIGVASTGTAIGTLSGAALTNASLAWLGGGALAAGGGGMAAGTLALGGITIGPALMVAGLALNAKGEKALTEAKDFEAKCDVAIELLKAAEGVLQSVGRRSEEIKQVLAELEETLHELMDRMQQITPVPFPLKNWAIAGVKGLGVWSASVALVLATNRDPFIVGVAAVFGLIGFPFFLVRTAKQASKAQYSEADLKTLEMGVKVARTLSALLEVGVVDEAGNVTQESESILKEAIAIKHTGDL